MAIFLVCEIGERMTKEFSAFNESLILSDWYTYPIGMRRIFALILANAQKPVIVQGFASTFCVREYFRLVIVLLCAQFKFRYDPNTNSFVFHSLFCNRHFEKASSIF